MSKQKPSRTIHKDGEPWFVVSGICKTLEVSNVGNAIEGLDEDDIHTADVTDSLGRMQTTKPTSESNLHELIFKSRKGCAKLFY